MSRAGAGKFKSSSLDVVKGMKKVNSILAKFGDNSFKTEDEYDNSEHQDDINVLKLEVGQTSQGGQRESGITNQGYTQITDSTRQRRVWRSDGNGKWELIKIDTVSNWYE